jgi:sugar phosphate permease
LGGSSLTRALAFPNRLSFACLFCFSFYRSPNNIITSAVAADLASHPSVRGSNKSLGTVTGLINGCGSITASVGLLAVGPLQEAFGWSSVWVYLIGCTTCGTLLMGTKIYSELFPTSEADLVV